MDNTCSCQAFLSRRIQRLSIPFLVIFTILVSSIECVQLLPSWDFAVTHGQEIVLTTMSSGTRQVLAIPPPISSIDQWQNSTVTNFSIDSNNHTKAADLWKHQTFKKLEFDPHRGLFFIISSPWNLQSIVVFNVTSNQTHSLMTKDSRAPIGGVVYHNGSLYWTNRTSNSIWKMNASNEITNWTPAEDFYKPANGKLRELAIDAKTNTLFFSISIQGGYQIQYLDCLNLTTIGIVTESQDELLALTTDDSFLYWVEGSEKFYIQRVPLANLSDSKEIIQEGKSQVISTISVACSQNFLTKSLFWSTCNSKTVWQRDNISINTHEAQQQRSKGLHFGNKCPQGIISRSFAFKDWSPCDENITTTSSSGESKLRGVITSLSPLVRRVKSTTTAPQIKTTTAATTIRSTSSSTLETTPSSTTQATSTTTTSKLVVPISNDSENGTFIFTTHKQHTLSSSTSYHFVASTANIIFTVVCSSLLIIIVILIIAVVYLYRKVKRLQRKPRIRRRVIVSRSSRDNSIPSMCELVDIENCCNMNECETPCYERLGSDSSNSSIQNEYKTKGKSRTEDKERLIDT